MEASRCGKPHSEAARALFSATERFINNTANATSKRQYSRHPKGVEISQRRRLLLTQVIELLHSQLLGGDRIAVLLNEERLSPRKKAAGGGVEGIKILPEPQDVKLIAPLLEGLGQRHSDAAPFIS